MATICRNNANQATDIEICCYYWRILYYKSNMWFGIYALVFLFSYTAILKIRHNALK